MKAAQITDYGQIENIHLVDIDMPEPGQNQVQVEVHAASLNPVDSMVLSGNARSMGDIPLPATLGVDFAGVITKLGNGVETVAVGDKVYGQSFALMGHSGAFAEYAVTDAGNLALAPTNISMNEAASLPLVGASAIQALTEHLMLSSDSKLLIHGASGGIGGIAIQIAKNLGAHVTASAKTNQIEYVKNLGADEVVNLDLETPFADQHNYDAALVLIYGTNWDELLAVLKPGSTAVSLVGPADDAIASAHQVTVIPQMTSTNTQYLDMLRDYVEKSVVTPQVAEAYPLDQIQAAFTKREAGGMQGKIVIEIKQ